MSSALPIDRRPIVISGPSGVGKGTLIDRLRAAHPLVFTTTVSHTTRKPRHGEEDGVAYHFVSRSAFQQLIADNGFVEHADFGGNLYGTSKATIQEQSSKGTGIVLLDIELQGVKSIKAHPDIDARFVFIKPPSLEVLEIRLRGRGSDSDEDIENRLAQAKVELDYSSEHPGFHDCVIVNDELEQAFEELNAFVIRNRSSELNSSVRIQDSSHNASP